MTTVDEVNRDKTKVPNSLFFVTFCLSVLLLNSMSKLVQNRCTCELIIKLYSYIRVCKRAIASLFLCLNPLFSVVQL